MLGWWMAGWEGGGQSWQVTQDKPVSGGRDGEDKGAGVLDQSLCLP